MNSNQMGIDLLREWDFHNRKHHCYYEESEDTGTAVCPASHATLRHFLSESGFPVERLVGPFFGRDLNEPNFRSRISGQEKPVSIRDLKDKGTLRRNTQVRYQPTTDDVLRSRAQRAAEAPSENDEGAWQVQAMDYFKERLDEIHESMVRAFAGVMAEQSGQTILLNDILTSVNALEDKVAERSEAAVGVKQSVTVTFDDVPADIAEELQGELQKRVERMLRRRRAQEHSAAAERR